VVKTKNIYYEIDLANEHIINKAASISHQEAFDSCNVIYIWKIKKDQLLFNKFFNF